MDLNELQQRISNFITVMGSWVLNVGKLYFSDTPENVTVDMIDANGNLTTTTLPNVAQFRKTVWDDVGGALGQFARTVYVDSVNGDDNNSGASSSPFKTLKKAVESSPYVGIVVVHLSSDDFLIDRNINFGLRKVYIYGGTASYDGNKNKLIFKLSSGGTYNSLSNFRDVDSIKIYKCEIEFDITDLDPDKNFVSDTQIVSYASNYGVTSSLYLSSCKVNLPDESHINIIQANGAGNAVTNLMLYGTEVNSAGDNSYLAGITNGTMSFSMYGSSLSGSKSAWTSVFKGISGTTDNPSMNMLSNINFG